MALTEADWKAAQPRIKTRPDAHRAFNETLLRQAAVSSQLLTGHPAWDKYLQTLQAELDTAHGELHTLHEKLSTPLTNEQIHLSYVAINVIHERIRVLTFAMSLPTEIVNEHRARNGTDQAS